MGTIKAVSLDVGWTLAYPFDSMWQIFSRLCGEAGAPSSPQDCERLVRTLSAAGQEHALAQFQAGASYSDSDGEFAGMFAQLGQLTFGQAGLADQSAELAPRFLRAFWSEDNWLSFPDTIAGIKALRSMGVRVGILSNAPSDLPLMLERMGIRQELDFTVVSAIEGVKKPDRRIFERTLERAGVKADEHLHVGDMYLEDILGSAALGIRSLLMERGEHALFPSFPESAGRELDPRHVVRNLPDIVELVRG